MVCHSLKQSYRWQTHSQGEWWTFSADDGLCRSISGREQCFFPTLTHFFHTEMEVDICNTTWALLQSDLSDHWAFFDALSSRTKG